MLDALLTLSHALLMLNHALLVLNDVALMLNCIRADVQLNASIECVADVVDPCVADVEPAADVQQLVSACESVWYQVRVRGSVRFPYL
jgi:hypothetical protein